MCVAEDLCMTSARVLRVNKALLTRDDTLTELPLLEQRLRKTTQPEQPRPSTTPKPDHTVEWVVLGTGAAAALAGGVLWAGARTDARQLLCASNGRAQASCDGVEPLRVPSQADFDARRASVRRREIGGYALMGLGLGAIGWSVWSLVSDDTPAKPATTTLHALPLPGSPSVSVEVRF